MLVLAKIFARACGAGRDKIVASICSASAEKKKSDRKRKKTMSRFKNALQEYLQKRTWSLPEYQTTQMYVSVDNVPVWKSRVVFGSGPGLFLEEESGPVPGKKVYAEQEAAGRALVRLLSQHSLNFPRACSDNQAPPCMVVAAPSACAYSDNQAPPCMVDTVPSASANTSIDKTTDMDKIVYVDADQISFVNAEICRAHPTVEFRFYFAHGANLPHVSAVLDKAPGNTVAFEASAPSKHSVNTMILKDMARDKSNARSLIVARAFLDNVGFASTKKQLNDWLAH
jgi:hypothetical protein